MEGKILVKSLRTSGGDSLHSLKALLGWQNHRPVTPHPLLLQLSPCTLSPESPARCSLHRGTSRSVLGGRGAEDSTLPAVTKML